MGAFAETANVDYRLSFADQEKQTSVFRIYDSIYIYIAYIFSCFKRKQKLRRFSLIHLPFAYMHIAHLSVFYEETQMEVIRLQTD
jgi:hypothetical protein